MDEFQKDVAIRAFADQAKKYHREWLVYRAFAQLLKSNGFEETVEETLNEARHSAPLQQDADAYDEAIEARIPPSVAQYLEEAAQKMLEALASTELPN